MTHNSSNVLNIRNWPTLSCLLANCEWAPWYWFACRCSLCDSVSIPHEMWAYPFAGGVLVSYRQAVRIGWTVLLFVWTRASHEEPTFPLMGPHHGAIGSNYRSKESGLLIEAARMGHADAVTLLLEYDAPIDLKDEDQRTPLSCSAESGHDSFVKPYSREEPTLPQWMRTNEHHSPGRLVLAIRLSLSSC